MPPAKLQFSYCNPPATIYLTTGTSPMSSTELCAPTSNLGATLRTAPLPTAMLDAELSRSLGRFRTPLHSTASTTTVARTKIRPTNGRFTTALSRTSLTPSMPRTKVLITGPLITSRIGTSTPSSMSNAKPRRPLSALLTARKLTVPHTAMFQAIRFPSVNGILTAFDATQLLVKRPIQCQRRREGVGSKCCLLIARSSRSIQRFHLMLHGQCSAQCGHV
mmetsp:Transcript_33744/g.48856  ORF Transcript_33744/g.48856 Transcript_33744/m.48856 type:complete len:220 (-) Transcript_33744:1664-2323(-)